MSNCWPTRVRWCYGWFFCMVNSLKEKDMTCFAGNLVLIAASRRLDLGSVEKIDSRTVTDRHEGAPLNRPEQNEISVLVSSISEQGAELNELSRQVKMNANHFTVLRCNDRRHQFQSLVKKKNTRSTTGISTQTSSGRSRMSKYMSPPTILLNTDFVIHLRLYLDSAKQRQGRFL